MWAISAVGLLFGAAIASFWVAKSIHDPTVPAKIVRIDAVPLRYHGGKRLIVAATPDGRRGFGVLASAEIRRLDCNVGDAVRVGSEGAKLVIKTYQCGKGTSGKW